MTAPSHQRVIAVTPGPRVDPNQLEAFAPMKIATLWALRTPHGLGDVLTEGFFSNAREHGLRRNDIVLAVCECESEAPKHALLVVTRANEDGHPPAVALWVGPAAGGAPTPDRSQKERRHSPRAKV